MHARFRRCMRICATSYAVDTVWMCAWYTCTCCEHVCVCVCECVCVCVVCVCVCVFVCVCMCVCVCVCVCVVCVYLHLCVYMLYNYYYIYLCVCMCVYIYLEFPPMYNQSISIAVPNWGRGRWIAPLSNQRIWKTRYAYIIIVILWHSVTVVIVFVF